MPDPATIPGIVDAAIAEATGWGASHLEVVLVRHGQPLPEEERRAGETLDPPLSALGRRQAAATSSALAGVEAVYGSDLARAAETAQIIGDRLGVPVRTMPHASLTRVRRSAGRWRVQSANETAHLVSDLLTA
jgi:probable phosphoglycerate mutase